jgi:Rieske 2Fe-2S family protein
MNTPRTGSRMEASLPSSSYCSPAHWERERTALLAREWFCIGREEQLAAPGDHVVAEVAGDSVLVVRSRQGELKAHFNVCRHRGAALVAPELDARWKVVSSGGVSAAGTIRCPYHHWTYSHGGELLNAPFLGADDGVCKAELKLYPVAVEAWAGFVFVRLRPPAAPGDRSLAAQTARAASRAGLAAYPLADLRVGHRIEYEVEANWKLVLENYNECYHCGPVHPELCEVVPAFRQAGGNELTWEQGVPHRPGAYTFTRSGTTRRKPFATLTPEEVLLHKGDLVYPNLMISASCDHVAAFVLWPLGPALTRVQCLFLFDAAEMARPDFDPMDAVEFWDQVNRQDWAICERVQRGLQSSVHERGWYAPMEDASLDIRRYLAGVLGDA